MAEILASIQRILSENEPDQPAASSNERSRHSGETDDNVLVLEKSMMVSDDAATVEPLNKTAAEPPYTAEPPYKSPLLEAATSREPAPRQTAVPSPHPFPLPEEPVALKAAAQPPVATPEPAPAANSPPDRPTEVGLVASSAAAIAASSIGNLVRTLTAERVVPVQRGGLTIEDLVREELRPLLKGWLDTHLPPLVEKLVQVEIERVVNRATS